ncbi:hypothetical protein PG994_002426 [Apiospora phragmitis]|uniref:Xylanolytic transcriptional activator regulatory domain-containing protein n=1 Tax=Apiospora phragmitis TaxID=2905665 RepID=A0ABR1WWI5_9PEZI
MPSRRVPLERRKRTEISCDKCKSRKQKCHRLLSDLASQDGDDSRAPCRYCETHGFPCVTTQTRKRRVLANVEESLEARVGLLERLVQGLVPGADTTSVEGLHALGASLGIPAIPEQQQQPNTYYGSSSSLTPAGGAASSSSIQVENNDDSSGGRRRRSSNNPAQVVVAAHDDDEEKVEEQQQQMPVLRDQQGQMQYIGPASSYIFQIRMRAMLAGRNSHGQSQGQFFLFANHAVADKAWVGKVADLGREMSIDHRTPPPAPPHPHEAVESPASDGSESDDDNNSEEQDDGEDERATHTSEDSLLSGTIPDRLVDAFFERIHPDFPVLSEECFRRKYERFRRHQEQKQPSHMAESSNSSVDVDASWVCSFLCVLLLARRTVLPGDDVLSTARGQNAEDRWWRKVHTLLPSVVFTSSIAAVQALLLAALHLNNTNNKDSCWTLTGAAVRISIAIGLHRDAKVQEQFGTTNPEAAATGAQNPMLLLRKRLWWTLYEFELMQAASLDRPSAICDASCNTSAAIQSSLATPGADATMEHSTHLLRMLSQACRVVRTMNNSSSSTGGAEDVYNSNGPLSRAASLIRDLRRWRDNLPHELSQQAATAAMENNNNIHGQEAAAAGSNESTMTPRLKRSLLLMHVQYHHILCVITRNPMLTSASHLFDGSSNNINDSNHNHEGTPRRRHHPNSNLGVPEGGGGCNAFLTDVCIDAAQASARLLLRLDADGLFDQVTGWDFYFLYQAAQVLVLGVMYDAKRGGNRVIQSFHAAGGGGGGGDRDSRLDTSRALLHSCAELAARVAQIPLVPGTNHRFAVVVGELVGLVDEFIRSPAVEGPAAVTGPPATSSCFPMPENGSSRHQPQAPYHPNIIDDSNTNSNQTSQMEIDAAATFESNGLHHEGGGEGSDLVMAETPSDIQFPADMAAHFGFPDGSWTYREGQWNDFGGMILGGGFGP